MGIAPRASTVSRQRPVHIATAILYAAFGQPEKALVDFAKAIELEPQHPGCGLQRAGFYIDQGKGEQALADFEKALEVQPAKAGDCNNLAWYLATCPDPRAEAGARGRVGHESDRVSSRTTACTGTLWA